MKITKVSIKKFRGFEEQSFELGSQLTIIAGQNGTQKSTLLGIITQTFTLKKDDPMRAEKPLCGGSYISSFNDKFRLSPTFDKPKQHEWTMSFDGGLPDFTVESIKRTGYDTVRFWKKGARQAGDGYVSFPTIFLSLKRLVPAAEERDLCTNDDLLTAEELDKFKKWHNKILIAQTPISSATAITSKNKQSLGVSTDFYDWNQNSMGQDNLGKILLALFSFRRLKESYPNAYKGGILAIDELDATMYPASQIELLKVLRSQASELKLQIIFTTHSLSLLKAADELYQETNVKDSTKDQVKILYLKISDDKIIINKNWDFKAISLNLYVTADKPTKHNIRIPVYTEDKENILLTKAILKQRSKHLEYIDTTMSCSSLIDLVYRKIPAFSKPYAIVVLDGDVKQNTSNKKKLKDTNNVLLLPGILSPEREVAKFLNELSDNDALWENICLGYSKQVCFRDYSYEQINANGNDGRKDAKAWFNTQLPYWGRNGSKVLNAYLKSVSEERDTFIQQFEELIKHYPH